MKLLWTRRGLRDLLTLKDYIRSEQPAAAAWIGLEIERTAAMLADFPDAGLKVPGVDASYFAVPDSNYILIYRVHADRVSILMVVHGATNWRRKLPV